MQLLALAANNLHESQLAHTRCPPTQTKAELFIVRQLKMESLLLAAEYNVNVFCQL